MKETIKSLEQELDICRSQLVSLQEQLSTEKKKRVQLEENKEGLMAVFDGFPEPLFLLNRETRIQMLNRAATVYCQVGYKDAIGELYAQICPLEANHCGICAIENMPEEGKVLTFERHVSGSPDRAELITLFTLPDGMHAIEGTIFHVQDITEKSKMNEQLILADRLSSLTQLSSGVSHEIRNPLASIMLFVDILADPKRFNRSSHELEILTEVKVNVQEITDIITRIFDFSVPNSSTKLPLDINKLMEDIHRLWTPKMKRACIETKLSLQGDLPHVTGDSVELQQAFSNLILNGLEAMVKGGTLTISTATTPSGFHQQREVVSVTVQDTGRGISSDVRQTIFNPFVSTKKDHVGLGLSISHQIIKRHGGILSCDKSDDTGTIFSIELPLNKQQDMEERE